MNERVSVWKMLLRLLVTLLANLVAVLLAARWLDGFTVEGDGVLEAALIGIVGSVVSLVAVRFAFPVVVYSLGLVSILINVLAVKSVAWLLPGVDVATWGDAFLVALLIALATNLVSWLLALDDEATFTRSVVRRSVRRAEHVVPTDEHGLLFLEIDGCSHGVLQRAMRAGWMPNLSSWLETDHRLEQWYTDLSSQTGASQAGILLGSNEGIVAFRWWERDRKKVAVTSNPKDAAMLQQRLSTGEGLLADGGASRNNIFSGDATSSSLTLSTLSERGGASRIWGPFFANPNNVLRTILLVVADVAHELSWQLRYRRRGVEPRLRKGWKYPLVRAATTTVMRDLATEMVVADVVRGAPAVYATFVGYDEVAHHDGVERPPALDQLRLLDRQFARIRRATRFAPRPYDVVVLSDHGQSQGATFLQRYGTTLEALVRDLAGGASIASYTEELESVTQLNASLGDGMRLAGDGSPVDVVERPSKAEFVVLASGSLGLVNITDAEVRLTRDEIDARAPELIRGLTAHPGIGWLLVKTADGDGVVLGGRGSVRLSDGEVEGEDPLAGYGRHALQQVRRHHAFEHVPDLLVMAQWDAQRSEVPAFEELIGSHGGMGGEQGEPFVMFPRHLSWPDHDVVGAGELHRVLKSWRAAAAAGTTPAP